MSQSQPLGSGVVPQRLYALVKIIVVLYHTRYAVFLRIPLFQRIVHAQKQRQSSGNDDQHHGGEDADIGKTCRVLFHPVHHGGNADEMLRLVVIPLVLFQELQKRDAPGCKHQIRADDDQDYCDEKHSDSSHRIGSSHGDIVSGSQADQTCHSQDPLGLRFFFPGRTALEQIHRLCAVDVAHGVKKHQQENAAEQRQTLQDGACGNIEPQRDLCSQHMGNHQVQEFIQQDPQDQSGRHGDDEDIYRFQEDHPADMLFLHA